MAYSKTLNSWFLKYLCQMWRRSLGVAVRTAGSCSFSFSASTNMRDLRGGANCNMLHCKGSFVMISLLSSIEIDPNTCVLNESKKVLTHFVLYDLPTQIQHPPKKRGHTTLDQVSTLLQESSKLVGGMRKKQLLLLLHFFLCSLLNPWGLFLAYWYHFTMTHLSFFSTSLLKACNHHHRRRECASGWDGLQVLMMMMEEGKAIFIKLGPKKKGKGNMVERAL